jgi:hypothetical protein
MAEISCPSCGKLNPEGVDECQFCQADLSSATTSQPEVEVQAVVPDAEIPSDESPAQEQAYVEETEKDPSETGSTAAEEEPDTPEWLRRIRVRLASETAPREPGLGIPSIPEWDGGDQPRGEMGADGQVMPSREFLDWTDPERQVGDTVPVVPIESTGPFAAAEDAFPPEQFLPGTTSPAFSYNLRITSTQHAHADLLDSIVHSEGLAAPLPRLREPAASPLLRWGVTTILFLSILWPLLTGREGTPMPFIGEEAGQVNNLIEQLPEDASVLLSFDYDPGFSGELDAAATAVVDHLISRGAYLTLVSTIPAGPVLAERFLSQATSRHNLIRNTHYINLGFVPGGPTGLVSLAENLQRALPYTLDGEAAWNQDEASAGRSDFLPLEGIEQVSDFNLVLVLVDDSFTARAWIEQVQPSLAVETFQTPMAMVVSAQVEPLVRPYYDANPRQLQGFVSGLRGGAAYEQLTGRDGMAGFSWDGFISGLSVAGLMLLVGGLAGMASSLFDQRKEEQRGGRS